ncbi:MAG: insulinase family protein [Chitinophagaceae bacterium]|nr:insulinase family protein [Chitinophagaceae bacterium]
MFKKLILSLFMLGTCASVMAQAKLVEKITKKSADEVVIPYEKYVFPNGLTLIVHEDHSDPLVHVDVTYHVGSAREEIGKSGFAHFFEHMMFQGSDHVADEQHFKIITEAGGTLNGTTNKDRTNYFETVPRNQVEKMLWLEADRMGFLLDAVTQQKFEIQRATVKNERGQNYDNRPYGLVQETLAKNIFPYGHPYSWLTIGYVEDLNRVNVQDLKNFFLRWYGPNNAVITIGGDIETSDMVKLVDKYFGSIPQCPKVEPTVLPMPVIDKDRYVSMLDGYAKLPMLVCAIPTVPSHHPDEPALDCLAEIMGGTNSSILYQSLVKTQRANSASCSHPTDELAGMIQFQVMPKMGNKPGGSLKDMENEIREGIKAFETRGVTDDDIAKFRASKVAGTIYGLESVSGKVSQLASAQTFTGDANYIKKELARYESVTREDVIRVYNQYVKGKSMVILSVLTKGTEGMKAGEDNYKVETNSYKAPDYGYNGLKYTKAKDKFDRNKLPAQGPNPSIIVPKYKKMEMDNMKVISSYSDELPIVVISIGLKGGRLAEQKNYLKTGLATLFTSLMDEDTKNFTSEEMSIKLDKLGSSISINTDLDETTVQVRTLKKNLTETLDLLEERLLRPNFTQDAFDRIKSQTLENIKNSKSRAAVMAGIAYSRINYGSRNVLGYPSNGTEESVNAITLKDVEDYYKNYFSRDGMNVVIVGDVSDKESLDIVARLNKLPATKVEFVNIPDLSMNTEPKTVYLVNIPKAAQTEFRVGYITNLKYDATGEYYRCGLMNYPLGGAFNSRINLNLREDKGWTYGARSGFSGNKYSGNFTFSSGIKTPATDSALSEVMREMNEYVKNGIKPEELNFLKNAIGQSDARKYETYFQKAGFLGSILKYDLAPDFVDKQNEILKNITAKEINALAKKWVDTDKIKIIMAGDKEKIAPALEKMGYNVVDVDSEGTIQLNKTTE